MHLMTRRNIHIYGWTPRSKRQKRWLESEASFGLQASVRRAGHWRHYRVAFSAGAKPDAAARGTYSAEYTVWRTRKERGERMGRKRFVRFKVGLGDRRVADGVG